MGSNVFMTLSEPMFTGRSVSDSDEDNNPTSSYGSTIPRYYKNSGGDNKGGGVELLSFDFKIEQLGSEEGGRPRSVEAIARSEVEISKFVDSRSPLLFRYCCSGEFVSEVNIYCFSGVGNKPYLTYRMGFVHVSSYQPSMDEDHVPTEKIGLRYGQMEVQWDQSGMGSKKQGNALSGTIESRWSWVINAPGWLPDGAGIQAAITGKMAGF